MKTKAHAQSLMIAHDRYESTWDNFGKFIYQFQPKIKTFIRKLERILIKLCRENVFLLFNQTSLNEKTAAQLHKHNFYI